MNVVKTDAGYVSGTTLGEIEKQVNVYRGIPYATPPVGALRWKPPQRVSPWSGIRECTAFRDAAAQEPPGPSHGQQPRSEDCLYLNVLAPEVGPANRLPVMVWFHGGALQFGSGNGDLFNSIHLPQHCVVLVTVNHRLNDIGLLAHPLLSAESNNSVSGNYAVLDLLSSLDWVKRNIAHFGGDPCNVTIFGQSGGGWKVTTLLVSPLARGLFHRAIIQSGGGLMAVPLKELERRGKLLFAKLGIDKEKDPLGAARALPWSKILSASAGLAKEIGLRSLFEAAIDGGVIPGDPIEMFKARKHNAVPLIQGINLGELATIAPFGMIPYYVEVFRAINKGNSKGYAYVFDQVPAGWRQRGIGSCHGMEVSYALGTWANLSSRKELLVFAGPNAADSPDPGFTNADRTVSEAMMTMWSRFAKTGDPNVEGLTRWPAWDEARDQYLYITEKPEVRPGFSKAGQRRS